MNDYIFNLIKKYKPIFLAGIVLTIVVYTAANYENVIRLWKDIVGLFQDSSKKEAQFEFLMFPDKGSYIQWVSEINYKLRIPSHPRNSATDKVDTTIQTPSVSNWILHPDKNDKRGICTFLYISPFVELLDSNSEKKYNYIKLTFRQAESIGFINDDIDINHTDTHILTIDRIYEIDEENYNNYTITKRSYDQFTGFRLDILFHPNLPNELRNKYFFDCGEKTNLNRISYYFNSNNELCLRIIDSISNAYILNIGSGINNKRVHLGFMFDIIKNTVLVRINNSNYLYGGFSDITFSPDSINHLTIGNSFTSFYGARMTVKYYDVDFVNYLPIINKHLITNMADMDFSDKDNIYIDEYKRITKLTTDEPRLEIQ